jgi:long-chain acyl-CoA synthetase
MSRHDKALADLQLPEGVRQGQVSMPGLLKMRASRTPHNIALREKQRGIWQGVSWSEYFERVQAMALYLRSTGFGPGDKLVIASDCTPEWFYADMAAQSLGGVTVGIYPTNPWPELQYIVRHCRAKVAICGDQEQTDKVLEAMQQGEGTPDLKLVLTVDCKGMRHYSQNCLLSWQAALEQGKILAADPPQQAVYQAGIDQIRPDQDALIVYTSGTTGMPKGARISHRSILLNAAMLGQVQGYNGKPMSVVCYLPLCHVAERLMSPVVQLVYGSVVYFAESIDAVTQNLREIGPSYFFGVPRIWEKLQQQIIIASQESRPWVRRIYQYAMSLAVPIARRTIENNDRPVNWRDALLAKLLRFTLFNNLLASVGLDRAWVSMTGGASISPSVILFFKAMGLPIYQIYGMTETSGVTHCQRPAQTRLGWCGSLLPEVVEHRLAEDGELLVRGPIVFSGYLYDEEASAKAVDNGWLHTGDVVEINNLTQEIQILDRKKAILITSGGKNITPSLIENALKESLYISEAILLGDGRNFLSALIQIDLDTVGKWAQDQGLAYTTYESLASLEPVRQLIDQAVQQVNDRFSRVENIRKFVLLKKQLDHDDGELTATMKVRRNVIEKKFAAEIEQIYGPTSKVQL